MVFDCLAFCPPTPPKDTGATHSDADETLQFLQDPFGEKVVLPKPASTRLLFRTPALSPSSDISIPSSSASTRKRVNFELQTCPAPGLKSTWQPWSPHRSSPLRPLPQTRVLMPLKSILKASDETPVTTPVDEGATEYKFDTFTQMLDAIVKLLASPERSSRLDAYHSLQRTMQAYDKVPDHEALKHKLSLLTQFIRRDIQARSPIGVGPDSQLIAQAMKLLMALFRIADLTSAMDDGFCSYIVERSIQMASDGSVPKMVANTHLAVLMQQNFRLKIMTPARVERILDALETIQERISGFSVQAYRVRIYRRLIQQCPDVMIKQMERWFKHIIKALMSSQKDINQSALDTAMTAAKKIGHDRHVAKSVLFVLNRVTSSGESVAQVMAHELERMLGGDHAAMVPQIWSVVTALMRESLNGQSFPALKVWLEVFEKCFRSDKDVVQAHANVAFCFLVYTVNLSLDTPEGWTKMFLNIPLHQLQQRMPTERAQRDAVISAYVTLLYYALRPTATFGQLDRYWKEYVADFWCSLTHPSSPQQSIAACQMVSALLDGSRKPWNEQRALDLRPQYMVQRRELPLLSPKWVRRSLSSILEFVEVLLDTTPWSEDEQREDEPIRLVWLSIIDSLVEASNKEIVASSETKDAIAHVINLLYRLWDRHIGKLGMTQHMEDMWADKFCFLVETVVQKLGAFQFAEKCLARNTDNDFEVASTPSHRSRHQIVRTSPLLHLTDLLINRSEGRLADTVRLCVWKKIIEPCFRAQNTRMNCLLLLHDCARILNESLDGTITTDFWIQLAALLESVLQEQSSVPDALVSRSLGKEYDLVVDLIALGSKHLLETPLGEKILLAFITMVRQETGEAALTIAVIEKISDCVLNQANEEEKVSYLPYLTILLSSLPQKMSRRISHEGRLTLRPSSPAASRDSDFDSYDILYGTILSVGRAAYRDLGRTNHETVRAFLAAFASSICHWRTSHLPLYLKRTQEVIRIWIEDSERKLQTKDESSKALHHEVVNMWKGVGEAVKKLPKADSQMLNHLEPLITAGFSSRRRSIINISISFWNDTFGKQENLQFPPRLEQVLRRLRNVVELSLPSWSFPEDEIDDELSFDNSDTSDEDWEHALRPVRSKLPPFKIHKSPRRSASQSPAVCGITNRRRPSDRTPKGRLRHENSQIQFEPILSSPPGRFNHEPQLLTERQQEKMERQRFSDSIFANADVGSPQVEAIQSSVEIHSDLLGTDELLDQSAGDTPQRSLTAVESADAFLESSPTPHARRSAKHAISDHAVITTPTAIRTQPFVFINGFDSSTPPLDREAANLKVGTTDGDRSGKPIFTYQRTAERDPSFYGQTAIDDTVMLEADARVSETSKVAGDDMPQYLCPATDLAVTAQIEADMRVYDATVDESIEEEGASELASDFVCEDSHLLFETVDQKVSSHDTSRKEIEDSQSLSHNAAADSRLELEAETSSVSCVKDSFMKSNASTEMSKTQALRRSARHATAFNSTSIGRNKDKQASEKYGSKMQKREKEASTQHLCGQGAQDDIIQVALPKRKEESKRISTSKMQSPTNKRALTPETNCRRSTRHPRPLSNLSGKCQSAIEQDGPVRKLAKRSANQDVSTAKDNDSQGSPQVRRLSHVQVTPKRSFEHGSAQGWPDVLEGGNIVSSAAHSSAAGIVAPKRRLEEISAEVTTPVRSFTQRVILTPRSILNHLRSFKDYLFSTPQLVLEREEEREFDDVLFGIRTQIHAAGRRGEERQEDQS